MVTFTTTLEKFTGKDAAVYSLHFPVPKNISTQFIDGEDRRVICTINDSKKIHTGLMPVSEYWYILANQALIKDLELNVGDTVSIEIEKDASDYGAPMPEELSTLLDQDETGSKHFHNLTPGKQRNLMYIVNNVKNVDSRLNKALAIVDHLNEVNGKIDFKMLNAKIKEYNQRRKLNH